MLVVSEIASVFSEAAEEHAEDSPEDYDGGCFTTEWDVSDPLRLTFHFDSCQTRSGDIVDGSAIVWLEYDGAQGAIGVEFESLKVGSSAVDGVVILAGHDGLIEFSADVDYSNADTDVRLVLNEASLVIGEGFVLLNGAGSITSAGQTYSADATDLLWDNPDNCYPTSGTLELNLPGSAPLTAIFAEDDLGPYAMVQIGTLPPFEMRLSCP